MSKTNDITQSDFAYQSGIGLMKEINHEMKIIGDRATWFASLLVAIIAATASSLNISSTFFSKIDISTLDRLTVFGLSLSIIYSLIVLIMLKVIIIPSFGIPAHNFPEKLMKGKFEDTKKSEIKRLNNQAKQRMDALYGIRYWLKDSIMAVIYAIPLALVIAISF